jgi:hypothetical protein
VNYKDYPLPIIKVLNELDDWSFRQKIPFEKISTSNGGFRWINEEIDNFEFNFYFQKNSPTTKEVYAFGVTGSPNDLITFDSKFHKNFGTFNHPYKIDIETKIISVLDDEFQGWLERVQVFEETTLFGHINTGFYEKEFYDAFEIIESEADFRPLDLKNQALLENLVGKTIGLLESSDQSNPEISDLIKIGESIKKDIPKSSKVSLARRISKWGSKIRFVSAQLSMEVLKHLTIEGIKLVLSVL